jgi:hypothetical protein
VSIADDRAIIFVPGIRPKPPAEQQAAQLRRCLAAAVRKAGGDDTLSASLAEVFQLVGWSRQFYGAHEDIAPDLPGIERLLTVRNSREDDAREVLSLGNRMTAAMYALGDRFPLLTTLFSSPRMASRVEEMHRYIHDHDGTATVARAMVADAVQAAWDKNKRVLLIGHSFGSVIAYDTLWELSRQQACPGKVDVFLSMGSPLTMRYIRARLKGAEDVGEERYPANIQHWLNLAAIGEVTALDRKMSDYFGAMITMGLLQSIDDDLELINQFRGPNGLNVHKCYGYMASVEVGRVLRDWVSDQADAETP